MTIVAALAGGMGPGRRRTGYGDRPAQVANLWPGTTYRLAVQGRDNCSGATSPLSEPLIVTTPH